MSQSTKKLNPESEDLFTTQDLLIVDDETLDETNDATINDLEVHPDDEFMAEMETEAELLEGMDEDDEPTENDIQEENVQTEFLVETNVEANVEGKVEGANSKPVLKAQNRISELPLSKVKHIIKLDPEVKLVNSEAVLLITKATEAFIRQLAKESFTHAIQQKKKTITKSHVDQALAMLPIEL